MRNPGEYERLLQEVTLKATTSGGKGGQHVNKVATRVELYFNIPGSNFLNEEQKLKLTAKLRHRISGDGILRITSSEDRSQFGNKEKVQRKFLELINKSLMESKKRKASAPSSSSVAERLRRKKLLSDKKKMRGGNFQGEE
jgi:ribosome-associated protein